jgi:hypothetical protein
MKTKIFCMAIALLFCLSCRTVRNSGTNTQNENKTDVSLSQQDTRIGSEETSVAISGKTEAQTERTKRQSGGSVQLSPPDSTGTQYPVVINRYKNETLETGKIIAEIEATLQQQIEENEKKILELREKLELQSKEKTVSKTGFTFIEKIGFAASGLLLLIVIFTVVKWLLKFRK